MTFICCRSVKSPPRRSRKKLQCEPKSVRFNGNVAGDVSSGILTDDRRDDSVASLFRGTSAANEGKGTNGRRKGSPEEEATVSEALLEEMG